MSTPRPSSCGFLAFFVALAALALGAAPAHSAVPQLVQLEGVLTAAAGSPAADGDYDIAFKLFDAVVDGNQLWTEPAAKVTVKSGSFQHLLGTQTGLDPALFAGAAEVWLSVQVGADPPLGRKRIASAPLALRSAMAEGLDCSGCVKLAHLDPEVLAAFAKKADLSKVATSGAYADLSGAPDLSGFAKTAALAAVALSGAYADLDGLPAFAKVATSGKYADVAGGPAVGAACGTGLVMKGIQADGTYDCVSAAFTAADLPKDGLDEVSNGLLFNQFNEVATNTTVVEIPDNNPVGISSLIEVPDFGVAQALSITAEVANSDTANLKITAIDPDGTKYVLWNKTAKGTVVKTTWPTLTKTVSGDLTTWIGKNPKGKWYLEVIDLAFLNNAKDGALKSWSVNVQVLASAKVGVGGALQLKGAAEPPIACTAATVGSLYFDTVTESVRYCAGGTWKTLADSCGNGIVEPNEGCDDGNNTNGDGCSATCQTVCGDTKVVGKEECDDGNTKDGDGCSAACVASVGWFQAKPGTSCANILDLATKEGTTAKNGAYWIKPDATVATYKVTCDMETEGGGWTRIVNLPPSGAYTGLQGVANAQEYVDNGTFQFSKAQLKASNREVLVKETVAPFRLHRYDFKQGTNPQGEDFVGTLTGDRPATVAVWNWTTNGWQSMGNGACNGNNHSQWNCTPPNGVRFHYATRDWTGDGGAFSNDGWSWFTGYNAGYGNYAQLVKNWNGAYNQTAHEIYVR
jgi:cysteine-rich repeat protein